MRVKKESGEQRDDKRERQSFSDGGNPATNADTIAPSSGQAIRGTPERDQVVLGESVERRDRVQGDSAAYAPWRLIPVRYSMNPSRAEWGIHEGGD